MPRPMPPLAQEFDDQVAKCLQLATSVELARTRLSDHRLHSGPALFHPARLEAFYEIAFLRIYVQWEVFLEETFIRYLCGYESSYGPAPLLRRPFPTLAAARAAVLGDSDYVSWQRPSAIARRCRKHMANANRQPPPSNCFHESVVLSYSYQLEAIAAIRNRIAHRSKHSKAEFENATMQLAGKRFSGASVGRFLRTHSGNRRWLTSLANDLIQLAYQITP